MNRRLFPLLPLLLVVLSVHAQTVHVSIDATGSGMPVNRLLYGINTARWDESLFPGPDSSMLLTCDRDAITKIKASGITVLKYPGGNDADNYVWNSPSNNPTEMSTDEYIALCRATGAEPFITINFNEPPALAASWVRYCRERGYNVRFWEVGDEQWGTWAKGHTSPEQYAAKYISFVKAMRAADPTIKVATNVPLGPHPEHWAVRVLKAAAEYVDMLTVTYYPQQWGKESDQALLASTALYKKQFADLKHDVELALGVEGARKMIYVNVGYNSVNHSPGPQTVGVVNALWVADMLGAMAESGTDIACYWAVHNAFPPRGGDYGYLSSEGSNTPYPSYYVFPMFSRHAGDRLIPSQCTDSSVSVYATRKGKLLALAMINTSAQTRHIAATFSGFTPRPGARWFILDTTRHNVELPSPAVSSSMLDAELPPWSLSMFEISAVDSVDPPPNLAADAAASASSFSTIGPHFMPSSAIDGDLSTRWNSEAWTKSGGDETQYYQLSWKAPQTIGRVRIIWGESPARAYRIETSPDGVRWAAIAEEHDGKGGAVEHRCTPTQGRFLRIVGVKGTKGISAYSLREVQVYER